MWKKIKRIFLIFRIIFHACKWYFVYLTFKHHLKVFDFVYLMFRGFHFKFRHYPEMIISYELTFVCLALFIFYYFIWMNSVDGFFEWRVTSLLYFLYFFCFMLGRYLFWFMYKQKNLMLE